MPVRAARTRGRASRSSCSARCSACSPPCSRSGRGATAARGYQFLALALLLVLVAAPVVSIGGTRPVVLGLVLTALTVCFLWLERLPLRPGLGIAAMLALALAGALPLASAANGEQPWFDYKAFAESLGPDDPVQLQLEPHATATSPGRATAPRCCASTPAGPSYWKVARPRRLRRRGVDRRRAATGRGSDRRRSSTCPTAGRASRSGATRSASPCGGSRPTR